MGQKLLKHRQRGVLLLGQCKNADALNPVWLHVAAPWRQPACIALRNGSCKAKNSKRVAPRSYRSNMHSLICAEPSRNSTHHCFIWNSTSSTSCRTRMEEGFVTAVEAPPQSHSELAGLQSGCANVPAWQ
eukprot:4067786-Amphidinium_carterae.1